MSKRKYFYATVFAALFFAQINCSTAQAADATLPAASGQPVIVTLTPTEPAAKPPATTTVPAPVGPATTATPPAVAPAKSDDGKSFLIWAAVALFLIGIYAWQSRRNRPLNGRRDQYHYGDPEDYNQPRGRILSDRERRDLQEANREYQPDFDDDNLDYPAAQSRQEPTLSNPGRHGNQYDAMQPQYQRQSKATLILPSEKDKRTLADVAGQPEAIARLKEICLWLKQPEIYNRHNAKLPRGMLFVGPPGTGKTLCAQALAGETHGSMFSIAASSFVEMYVGVGASRVRALFADAKNQRRQTGKPVIIFIDELDAVGGARNQGANSNSEREQTLNQLLVEMDGFTKNEGIIVVAATNRVDMLDPALRRKGRFDMEVHVDLPDLNGREAILQVHTRGKLLAPSVDFKLLARRTFGMSGADLEAAANEAAIIAARHQSALESAEREQGENLRQAKAEAAMAVVTVAIGAKPDKVRPASPAVAGRQVASTEDAAGSHINAAPEAAGPGATPSQPEAGSAARDAGAAPSQPEAAAPTPAAEPVPSVIGQTTPITAEMFDEAISIVESGDARRERFKAMSLSDKKQTAYHELGHAVVIHKMGGDPITKITILPRGRALGYVQTHSEGDRWNMTEVEMRKRITSAMAGRIAQDIFMQTLDTGAASDFEQANRLARKMVTQFGMSPLGAVYLPDNGQNIGPALSDKIDDETNAIVSQCAKDAREIIQASRQEIESLVGLLIEKETLFGSDFVAVFEDAEKVRLAAMPEVGQKSDQDPV